MIEREINIALLSEIWEKDACKKQKYEFQNLLQVEGLKYISTPRKGKRDGGAAIVANLKEFTLDKLSVTIPKKLEVVWGLMRPRKVGPDSVKEIIVGAFYSPPNSKMNSKLLDHIMTTMHHLLTKYPNAAIILGGDKNNLNISTLISGIPRLRQIVTKNTHGNKIVDVIMTNMHAYYRPPIIIPPIIPDDPSVGVPSDHNIPLALPVSVPNSDQHAHQYLTRTFRPIPESGLRDFGEWICRESWTDMKEEFNPTEQVEVFENIALKNLDKYLPQKSVKINPHVDKPFFTAELKRLDRQVKKEYRKHCKSEKYKKMKEKYILLHKNEAESYFDKNVRSCMEENPSKAYKCLRKLAAQPGDTSEDGTFTLLSHLEQNLSEEESLEKIAQHFASICEEFLPLNTDSLPLDVVKKISDIRVADIPELKDFQIYDLIRRSKKA